jgi:hypothetical protein
MVATCGPGGLCRGGHLGAVSWGKSRNQVLDAECGEGLWESRDWELGCNTNKDVEVREHGRECA